MGAKPSEFAWRARKGADGGTEAKRGQPGGTRARGWAARRYAGALGTRARECYGRAARPARGTRVGSLAVRGRAGHVDVADARALRADGSADPAARGCAGHAGVRVGSLPPLPPNLPVRPRYPPARLAPRRRPPGACPATPDTPQRAPGSPTRTQLPREYPPPRGGCVRLPSAHPPLEASPAPWRAPGERPTPGASGSQQTPSGRMPCHPRRAPGFPASTPGVRLAPSRRLPGARPATPGAHPAQRAPTHRSAPGSLARTWRAPAPRLSGHSRHGLRSLGPSGTRFWPFLPCFTSKQAFAMRKP